MLRGLKLRTSKGCITSESHPLAPDRWPASLKQSGSTLEHSAEWKAGHDWSQKNVIKVHFIMFRSRASGHCSPLPHTSFHSVTVCGMHACFVSALCECECVCSDESAHIPVIRNMSVLHTCMLLNVLRRENAWTVVCRVPPYLKNHTSVCFPVLTI